MLRWLVNSTIKWWGTANIIGSSLWRKYMIYLYKPVESFSGLFHSECQYILFFPIMYVPGFFVFLQCQKVQNNWQIVLKRAEINILQAIFKSVFHHISAFLLPFLTLSSYWVRYQEIARWMKQEFICIPLLYSKFNDCRIRLLVLQRDHNFSFESSNI